MNEIRLKLQADVMTVVFEIKLACLKKQILRQYHE